MAVVLAVVVVVVAVVVVVVAAAVVVGKYARTSETFCPLDPAPWLSHRFPTRETTEGSCVLTLFDGFAIPSH